MLDDAHGQEAGAGHFLTDAFSAGHVRTPRTDVKKYWKKQWEEFGYKDFKVLFVDWAATQMAGKASGIGIKKEKLVGMLTEMFETEHLDFGDLVSGVLHDYDNQAGVIVTVGSNNYQLYGDGYLDQIGNQGLGLAEQAVQAGLAELIEIRKRGLGTTPPLGVDDLETAKEATKVDGLYAAEYLMPEALDRHSPFNWKANDDGSVRLSTMLATPQFQAGWTSLAQKIVEEARLTLDTIKRAAANRFLDKLESDPMGSLLDILGPGPARLVIDETEFAEIDPDGYDPDAIDGPIDDGGGL